MATFQSRFRTDQLSHINIILTVSNYRISVRADPAKCLNDLTLLRSEPYLSCAQFVSSFRFNPQNANSTGVEEFCHKNCSQVMINSIQAVVTDCGLPSYEAGISFTMYTYYCIMFTIIGFCYLCVSLSKSLHHA